MIGGGAAIAVLLAIGHFHARAPSVPTRPLRIGFENNPPVQIRTATGFSGLSVEIVSDAARRAGIKLEWVETGTSSDEAFRKGLVDLWPLMVDRPYRRKLRAFCLAVYAQRPRADTSRGDAAPSTATFGAGSQSSGYRCTFSNCGACFPKRRLLRSRNSMTF